MCISRGKFLKSDSNSKNNNMTSEGMCMSGGKFQIKLLSEFSCNSHSTFYE